MAQINWTDPALSDLEAIADYIALDNPTAAQKRVSRIFEHVDQLEAFPDGGSKPAELKGWAYRQIVEPDWQNETAGKTEKMRRKDSA